MTRSALARHLADARRRYDQALADTYRPWPDPMSRAAAGSRALMAAIEVRRCQMALRLHREGQRPNGALPGRCFEVVP